MDINLLSNFIKATKQSSLKQLQQVYFDSKSNTVRYSNLEQEIVLPFETPYTLCIDSTELQSVLSIAKKKDVPEIEVYENGIQVTIGKKRLFLNNNEQHIEYFPDGYAQKYPDTDFTPLFDITRHLKDLNLKTSMLSDDDHKPAMKCFLFTKTGHVVGTNAHVLFKKRYSGLESDTEFTVSGDFIGLLNKLNQNQNDLSILTENQSVVKANFKSGGIYFRNVNDVKYPNYKSAIPTELCNSFETSHSELSEIVSDLNKIIRGKGNFTVIEISPFGILNAFKFNEEGKQQEDPIYSIELNYCPEAETHVCFDHRQIERILKSTKGLDVFHIRYDESKKVAAFFPEEESEGLYLCVRHIINKN